MIGRRFGALLLAFLGVLFVSFVRAEGNERLEVDQLLLKRAAAAGPQFEDLGWSWGKRSGGNRGLPLAMLPRIVRSWKPSKKEDPVGPQFDDLGWSWGKK
ncbi:hypothetical protein M3Y99_01696000 [Aphelenchoides fujianensis]|nr:hypothetical protein M3Y99_01696000 [Aphelenchoides fujianensis]